jgi:hypothetical protein
MASLLWLPHAAAAKAPAQTATPVEATTASSSGSDASDEVTADSAITPLVTPRVHEFVESKSDFRRSSLLAAIVVPLLIVLFVERELLVARGRSGGRVIMAYGLVLLAGFAMLVLVRLREYLG